MDDNPYLNDFYNDMKRWAFNLQVYFLNSRFRQVLEIRKSGKTVVQDRTIYEDAEIFAPNLHDMKLMSSRDFRNYFELFSLMSELVQPPDLMIYLRASVPTLVNQIQQRGRNFENSISIDYLTRLNERYEGWMKRYDLGSKLVINVDTTNFIKNKRDLSFVIDKIDAEIHGLF